MPYDLLFNEIDGMRLLDAQGKALQDEVSRLPEQRILNTSVEDLVSYLVEKYQIEVPTLDAENAVADQREANVSVDGFAYGYSAGSRPRVPGLEVTLEVPFIGDAQMFRVQPSRFTTAPPRAEIRGDVLVLRQSGTNLNAGKVQAGFESVIAQVEQYLGWQREQANPFNDRLPTFARQAVEGRRAKLSANQSLAAGLKFKLKERPGAPRTYTAPVQRKRLAPSLPPASKGLYKPEPVLGEDDYRNILKVMSDMALVMERSPGAFATMGEEDLRQHFLVQLNGHYEGKATGETFNYEGKTDILIRHDGRNIFVAECKFWRGEKGYLETIDQLLSYLSWRDTKAALVVFNKNRDFGNVLATIRDATTKHDRYKSGPLIEGESRFRYILGQRDDPSREVVVTVLAFDVPHAS